MGCQASTPSRVIMVSSETLNSKIKESEWKMFERKRLDLYLRLQVHDLEEASSCSLHTATVVESLELNRKKIRELEEELRQYRSLVPSPIMPPDTLTSASPPAVQQMSSTHYSPLTLSPLSPSPTPPQFVSTGEGTVARSITNTSTGSIPPPAIVNPIHEATLNGVTIGNTANPSLTSVSASPNTSTLQITSCNVTSNGAGGDDILVKEKEHVNENKANTNTTTHTSVTAG